MVKCAYCKEEIEGMPFQCRLPSSHECQEQKEDSERKAKEWQRKAKEILENIYTKESHSKANIDYLPINLSEIKLKLKSKKIRHNENKKIKKKSKILKKLLIILGIILIFFIIFHYPINKKIILDDTSQQAFNYINKLRIEQGINSLEYNLILYNSLLNISKEKSLKTIFVNSYEINQELPKYNNLTKKENAYINTFFIKGEGIEKFKEMLNEDYKTRKLILQEKYNKGAIACNLDYCTLIIYSGEIIPYNLTDISTEIDSKNIFRKILRYYINQKDFNNSESTLSKRIDVSNSLKEKNDLIEDVNSYSNKDSEKTDPNLIEDEEFSFKSPFKPNIDIYLLEKEIHKLVNEKRQAYGLSSLSWDEEIAEIARLHSQDMAENNYFEHINLQGQSPTDRANAKGYFCIKDFGSYYTKGLAENIFQNNLYDSVHYGFAYIIPYYIHDWNTPSEITESTINGWMLSPGHRENILTSSYSKEGIGVAISEDDKVYITQDFC